MVKLDKWEESIKNIIILCFLLFIDIAVLGPIVQHFVDLGLNNEITVGGVTAPGKELMDPTILYLYQSMWLIIDIIGIFVTISGILYYIKKMK